MDKDKHFILQKPVNWSLLNHGLSIPMSVWNLFQIMDPRIFVHGTSKQIKIIINNELFDAVLVNQNFNKIKFPNHKDIIQIRYSDQSRIVQKLREIFHESYDYFAAQRQVLSKTRRQLILPSDIHEFIRLYSTNDPDVFNLECNTNYEYNQVSDILGIMPEEIYESINDDATIFAR